MSDNVVIIGASHAAAEAVTSLRKQGWEGGITLIGDEPLLPYQRPPLSKGYFKGDTSAEKLLIKGAKVYENARVNLKLGTRVSKIDKQRKQIQLATDEKLDYSHLILATGTRARKLPIDGADFPQVCYLRNLADVDKIKSFTSEAAHMLVVGAGYIGLEVAASAVRKGIKVTVLEAMDRVLARVTSPVVSDFYQSLHAENDVKIRLNSVLKEFQKEGDNLYAIMNDGERIKFDCAVVGIGVLPNIELAEAAGLACDNGILVNEYGQTSDPNIYAVGDCSNHPSVLYGRHIRLESVPNAVEQAKVAASSICGKKVAYNQVPWFWSDQYQVKLQTVGLFTGYDQSVVRGSVADSKFSVFYLKDTQLIAMDAINSPADFMLSKKLVSEQACPKPEQLEDLNISLKSLL